LASSAKSVTAFEKKNQAADIESWKRWPNSIFHNVCLYFFWNLQIKINPKNIFYIGEVERRGRYFRREKLNYIEANRVDPIV
jgi:hypothetical protein